MWQMIWQIYPPEMAILHSYLQNPTLRGQMWQNRWQIYPLDNGNGNFRFLLIDSYSQDLRCGRSTPPENGDFIFLLTDSYS